MSEYSNTTEEHRVWPSLQRADGTTLELEPGETVELELPAGFEDSALAPVLTKKQQAAKAKDAAAVRQEKTEPADAETTTNEEPKS